MSEPPTARERLRTILSANGVGPAETDFHSWRCAHPDRFPGYCTCVDDLLDDLMKVLDDTFERGRTEQLTREDRRSLAMLYGFAAGQDEEIMHVKAVLAEHYKVAPKAAIPLLTALGYETETP